MAPAISAKNEDVAGIVTIRANQFPIKSVKLFGSDGAEVTRIFPLSHVLRSQDDPQVVEIVNLPSGFRSVDVSVTSSSGNVTILDHYYTSVAKLPFSYTRHSSPTLRELEAERLLLEDEKRLRQQNFQFLTTYMDSLAQCKSQAQPEASQIVSFFDEFVEIGLARSAVIAELDRKLTDVNNRIEEERENLSKLSSDLPVKVVTVLACNTQVPTEAAELTVSYIIMQVLWKPEYDLYVSMAENTPSPTVKLDFRCSVSQWTGENWENVGLTLTTADEVSQLIQVPEPKGIDVSLGTTNTFQPPHPQQFPSPPMLAQHHPPWATEHNRGRRRARENVWEPLQGYQPAPGPTFGQAASDYPEVQRIDTPQPAGHAVVPEIPPTPWVIRSKNPITHIASGSIFIPSDHAAHHVLVASLSLQAEFMRVAVPSVDAHVYYTCEVKNTSEYVLLPGTIKTHLNDKYVSSAEIQDTDLPQILECSLAVDAGVKTIHNRAPDALPSVGAFTGKATTTYTSATVVQNTHADPVQGVIVRSSIPLPADPRITIVLKEPAGLAEIDEGHVSVRDGCLARWSTSGGRKGKQAGLFEWVCSVSPGTEVLKAVWEVCAPKDLKLSEQERS